jgi:hypothetical protein
MLQVGATGNRERERERERERWTEFGLMTGFIAHFDTARDYIL